MAGGTFAAQNKVRPGVYINFEAKQRSMSTLGTRGIVALPIALSWGTHDGVIELLSTDLINGKSLAKVGLVSTDEDALMLRLALSNAYKAIIYRFDVGGVKAVAELGDLDVSALYDGTFGNRISVAVAASGALFNVITYVDGIARDAQAVADYNELVPNDFVTFVGEGTPVVTAGTYLTGGTNGTIDQTNYQDFANEIKKHTWNTMGVPYNVEGSKTITIDLVKDLRENRGKYVQAVLVQAQTNDEGIISVGLENQGYKMGNIDITSEMLAVYIAGLTAGSELTQSNTYRVVEGATDIINPLDDEAVEDALKNGQLVLVKRSDDVVVIEQDINTLHDFTNEKPYAYSKNKVIRILDGIASWIKLRFESYYIGKVQNNADGRAIFKADVIGYLNQLQVVGAIQNFESGTDVEVLEGNSIDSVICNLAIQPVDSMEKLYLTVTVTV